MVAHSMVAHSVTSSQLRTLYLHLSLDLLGMNESLKISINITFENYSLILPSKLFCLVYLSSIRIHSYPKKVDSL